MDDTAIGKAVEAALAVLMRRPPFVRLWRNYSEAVRADIKLELRRALVATLKEEPHA
jgi:hypothetical protein